MTAAITRPDGRIDLHGNRIRREGIDRCDNCGCKYWEYDRCIDCGSDLACFADRIETMRQAMRLSPMLRLLAQACCFDNAHRKVTPLLGKSSALDRCWDVTRWWVTTN